MVSIAFGLGIYAAPAQRAFGIEIICKSYIDNIFLAGHLYLGISSRIRACISSQPIEWPDCFAMPKAYLKFHFFFYMNSEFGFKFKKIN